MTTNQPCNVRPTPPDVVKQQGGVARDLTLAGNVVLDATAQRALADQLGQLNTGIVDVALSGTDLLLTTANGNNKRVPLASLIPNITPTTLRSVDLANQVLTITMTDGVVRTVDLSEFITGSELEARLQRLKDELRQADADDYLVSSRVENRVLIMTMKSGREHRTDLSGVLGSIQDNDTRVNNLVLDNGVLKLMSSDGTTKEADLRSLATDNDTKYTEIKLDGNNLKFTDSAGGTTQVDLAPLLASVPRPNDVRLQSMRMDGDTLVAVLSNGNETRVSLASLTTRGPDKDTVPTGMVLDGNTLKLTMSDGTVKTTDLSALKGGTGANKVTLTGPVTGTGVVNNLGEIIIPTSINLRNQVVTRNYAHEQDNGRDTRSLEGFVKDFPDGRFHHFYRITGTRVPSNAVVSHDHKLVVKPSLNSNEVEQSRDAHIFDLIMWRNESTSQVYDVTVSIQNAGINRKSTGSRDPNLQSHKMADFNFNQPNTITTRTVLSEASEWVAGWDRQRRMSARYANSNNSNPNYYQWILPIWFRRIWGGNNAEDVDIIINVYGYR